MFLFLLYLVACCVKGADLWDTAEFDSDKRAADTAKLINFINNADSFKVLYISRPDEDDREDGDDTNGLESMKLLHKTFDTYRKSNAFIDGANIQYISNPEVLEDYKSLPKERSDILDIIAGKVTTESSSIEEADRSRIKSSQLLKSFRKHFRKRKETSTSSSNFEVNEIAEKIVADYVRRYMDEEHYLPQDSQETKRFILRSKHRSNLGNPIIEPVLNTYTVSVNLQGGREPKINNNLNVSNKKILTKESRQKKSRSKSEIGNVDNSKKNISPEDEKDFLIKRFKIASKTKNTSKSTVNKESELNQGRKEKNDRPSKVRNSKVRTRQKTHTVDNTVTKDENKRKSVPNKAENKVSVNEQGINWGNDEKNNKRKPEIHDLKYGRETSYRNEDNMRTKPYSTKKTNNGEYYNGYERPKKESNEWNRKENDMNKKYNERDTISSNRNKKDNIWNKKDDNWDRKNDYWDKKDNSRSKERIRNKKDDNWDRKNDNWDIKDNSQSKERIRNKKDDNWDRKNDNWDKKDESRSKERIWNKKDYNIKNKEENEDDNDYKSKKYGSSENTRTVKTDDSGWGNYALFKNSQNKKNSMEKGNIEEEKVKPKVRVTAPKPNSYENYRQQREDYEKPKRSLRSFNRTPIPMVGKRPIYD